MRGNTAAMSLDVSVEVKPPRGKGDIRPYFERWALWRIGSVYRSRASSVAGCGAVFGHLQNGRGSRVCPVCQGAKLMPGHLVGSTLKFIKVPCPQCDGDGAVTGDLVADEHRREINCVFCVADPHTGHATGETADGRTCHKCHGGRRLIVVLKVHPATIKSTVHLGPGAGPDPVLALIDRTVEFWGQHNDTYWLARVVLEEYCSNGTQEMKALRLGVSRAWFCRNLTQAHRRATEALENNFIFF